MNTNYFTVMGSVVAFIFAMSMFFFAMPVVAEAACTYSGALNWGSCSANVPWASTPSGQSRTINDSSPNYTGSMTYTCSGTNWINPVSSCNYTPPPPPPASCNYTGTVTWGACSEFYSGSVPHGGSQPLTNSRSGYTGSVTYSCNNGSWSSSGASCNPVPPASCSFSGTQTWMSNCAAPYNNTISSGDSATLTNVNGGYNGSATYSCSNGTWIQGAQSCVSTITAPTVASINVNPGTVGENASMSVNWSGNNGANDFYVRVVGVNTYPMASLTSWNGTPASLSIPPGSYSVQVQACNLGGCSNWSASAPLTVVSAVVAPVSATINLDTASVAVNNNFTGTWSGDNVPASYNVDINGTPYPMGAATGWTGTPTALGLTPGNHAFTVQACNVAGCSGWSSAKNLTVTSPVAAPTTATLNLSAASVSYTTNFTANWSGDNSPTSYNIYIDGVLYPMASSTSWTGTPASLGLSAASHSIRSQACNSGGCGPLSAAQTLVVTAAAPTTSWVSLNLFSVATSGNFTATWSGDNGPTSYNMQVNSDFYPVGSANFWTGTPASLNLTAGDHLVYSQACNSGGCSGWSTPKTLTVTNPTNVFNVASSTKSPTISYVTVSPNNVAPNGNFTAMWSGNNSPTNYVMEVNGTEYPVGSDTSWTGTPDSLGIPIGSHSVRSKSCNSAGCSSWSNIASLNVSATTAIVPTTASISLIQTPGQTSLLDNFAASWSGNNAPTTYNIKVNSTVYAMGADTFWNGTPTSFALIAGTHYVFVQACNAAGCSPWSSPETLIITSASPIPTLATITVDKPSVATDENITASWSGNNSPTSYSVRLDSTVYNGGAAWAGTLWTGTPDSLGLTAGLHRLAVKACNSGGCSDWSADETFTVTNPVPSIPTTANVGLSPNTVSVSGNFTASWSGDNNPTSYNMRVNSTDYSLLTTSWTGTAASLGLAAGMHLVSVQACNSLGCSPWSIPASLTVTGTVSGVSPTVASMNIVLNPSIILTPINGFCANWSGDNNPTVYNVRANSTVYIMGPDTAWCGNPSAIGLTDGTHSVAVQACNAAGCSPWSASQPLVVFPVAIAPTISNIMVSQPTVNQADVMTVTWNGNNNAQSYFVMVNSLVYNVGPDTSWTGTPDSIGLTPGVNTLQSMACNSGGCSAWGPPVGGITYVPGPNPTPSPTPIPAPTLTFSATPSTVANPGDSSMLSWTSTNVTSCNASGDWSGSKNVSDIESTGALASSKVFTLTCTGPGGPVTRSVTVNVGSLPPAPNLTFTASNYNITAGDSVDFTWVATDLGAAPSCTASGGVNWTGPKVPPSGTTVNVANILTSQTYTLECSGSNGTVIESVTVNVVPVSTLGERIRICPANASLGQGTNTSYHVLYWSSALNPNCATPGSSDVTPASGMSFNPGTSIATVNRDGAGNASIDTSITNTGVATLVATYSTIPANPLSDSTSVTVIGSGPPSGPTPSGSINATTCTIPVGGTSCPSTVTWSSSDFVGVANVTKGAGPSFSGGASTNAIGVVQSVNPSGQNFTLSDGGGSFSVSDSANSTCAAGSAWNGTSCALAGGPPICGGSGGTVSGPPGSSSNCTGGYSVPVWDNSVAPPVLISPSVCLGWSYTNVDYYNATPERIFAGESSTLTGSGSGDSVTCSPSSQVVSPTTVGPHTYPFSCNGPGGLVTSNVTVIVVPPPGIDLILDSTTLRSGETTNFNARIDANYPTTCTVSGVELAPYDIYHGTPPPCAVTPVDHIKSPTKLYTSSQIVEVTCKPDSTAGNIGRTYAEDRVRVIPTSQEI